MGTSGPYADLTVRELVEAVAARTPAPGAGAAAAVTVATAAGLVAMAAGYATGLPDGLVDRAQEVQARALALGDEDAAAYSAVLAARSTGDESAEQDAWRRAVAVPLEIAECGARIAEDAAWLTEHGRPALRGDAFTGAVLAEAGARAAARLVELNVAASGNSEEEAARARRLADEAAAAVRRVT